MMKYIDIPIEDIDEKIEYTRALLTLAIRRSKVPIGEDPYILALSRTLDALINEVQTEETKGLGGTGA